MFRFNYRRDQNHPFDISFGVAVGVMACNPDVGARSLALQTKELLFVYTAYELQPLQGDNG